MFDHYGTDSLNARIVLPAEKTKYKQHEGGFTLGGPVVLPGYDGHNKTFFFGSLGVFYSRVGASGNLITVPTEAFKAGDFSGLVDAQGRQIPIFDPATTRPDGDGGFVRDQFPGNRIPANRISPGAARRPRLPADAGSDRQHQQLPLAQLADVAVLRHLHADREGRPQPQRPRSACR